MSELDKDIEIVKEFKKFCEDLYYFVDDDMGGHFEQVIGNQIANTKLGYLIFKEKLEKQDKELETYKKIAEKLAEELEKHFANCFSCKNYNYNEDKCKKYNNVKDCIIDWARKEIENENK